MTILDLNGAIMFVCLSTEEAGESARCSATMDMTVSSALSSQSEAIDSQVGQVTNTFSMLFYGLNRVFLRWVEGSWL